jgi:Protein of unknown function (DUF3105)
MSSRQQEKERRRREREAQEAAARKAAERGKRLRIVGAALGAVALAIVAVVLISSASGGDSGTGEPASADEGTQVSLPAVKDRNLQSAAETAGCELRTVPSRGSTHVTSKVQYQDNPPTSGNHNPEPALDGIYETGNEPAPENWVHTLEHGRVIFQYKPGTPQNVIDQLEALAAEPLNGSEGYKVLVMQNNTGMTPQVVALAWTQEMKCDTFTEGFIDAGRAFRAAYTDKGPEFIPPN